MNKKGFTLMEVIIAVSLLAIVSIVSLSIVANLLKSAVKSQSAIDVEQTSNFVLLRLKNDLAQAYKVATDGTTLDIYQTGSASPSVRYTIGECNVTASIYCVSRGGVPITDSTSDPSSPTKPNKSAVEVTVKDGSTQYFNVVEDTSVPPKSLAVNIAMKFRKPDATTPGNFSGETVLDTTIVLPSQ
jgi:prepilin-type N-terminal cleavage/methylation domain-containing protein